MKLKRFTAALTATVCSAVMLTSMPITLPAGAATMFSNDFEINYGGWYAESPDDVAELKAINGAGFEGSRGMRVCGRTAPTDGVSSSKDLYLEGGKTYDYSVRVFCETDQTFRLTLLTVDIDSGEETVKELDSQFVKGGTWAELSARYKAPANSKEFKMTITTDSVDDFYFDDVKVLGKAETVIVAQAAEQGLKDMLVNYGIRSGNILNGSTANDSGIKSRLLKDCNAIECENETKPDATLVLNGSTDTNIKVKDDSFAKIASWCADNGLGFRGHTLVWHSQTPTNFFKSGFNSGGSWVSSSVMDQRMESYIKNMFALFKDHYPNLNLYAYDVCNECVNDSNGGMRNPGENNNNGNSPWVQVYNGDSFIDKAFEYARKYAPSTCKLFYNDYNEYAGTKRDAICKIADRIHKAGNLDGVGMQSHVNAAWSGWSGVDNYVTAMKKYLNLGVDVQITELDVSCQDNGTRFSDTDQAKKYEAILKAALDWNSNPQSSGRVTLFQIWGPDDGHSWLSSGSNGLVYTSGGQPKEAYNTLISLVPKSQWGDGTKFEDGFAPDIKEPELDENGYWFHCTFESGTEGFGSRIGSETVTSSSSAAYAGSKSLYVSDRSEAYHGASMSLSSSTFKAGESYSFSGNVMYDSGSSSENIHFTMQYNDGTENKYVKIASAEATKGEWVQLANTSFEIPAGASDVSIYFECDGSTTSFYVDEVIGAPKGTKVDGAGQPVPFILGDVDKDGVITAKDLTLAKRGLKKGFADSRAENAADVDQSAEVDAADIGYLVDFLLAKINKFPVAERKVNFEEMAKQFMNMNYATSYKKDNENNPLYTQRFGADPGWLVYDGRLYVYTTADEFVYQNGGIIENDYSSGYINCLSSADLVNWTDHGQIPVAKTRVNGTPIARWANNAWAPDAAWKTIKGEDKFFLYFANNGSGIGVITADDPTFTKNVRDPLGHELISRNTPNSNVTWLFDPGVYYDPDTDTAIIAYGGGVPNGQAANTKQGRIAQLGSDMISIVGTPIDPGTPYLFEDSSMIKIGNTWYYSFCHNWDVPGGTSVNGQSFSNADIGYMTSTDPLKGYTYQGVVFKNTGNQRLDNGGNNHHSIIEFKGNYYVLYHSRQLEMRMGVNGGRGQNYRSPCIDKATLNNGKITCNGSQNGVSQIETLNPYETVQAETMANQGGIQIKGVGDTVVTDIQRGDWIKVKGVNFDKGCKSFTVKASSSKGAIIKVTTGSPDGEAFAYAEIPAGSNGEVTFPTLNMTGTKDICFVFSGELEFDSWSFS